MSILKLQSNVSPYRGLPVDDMNVSSSVTSKTGETIQLYYNNAGTLTADAGQAAGVVVMAKTAYTNILNLLGDSLGKKGDSSLTFTSTALTTEVGIGTVDPQFVESLDESSWATRMAAIGAKLANGEYYVDYTKGVIYAKKASTQVTLTSGAYKYYSSASGGASTSVGQYNATPPALADAATSTIQLNSEGDTKVAEQFAPKYEDNTNQVAWTATRPGVPTFSVDRSLGAVTKRNVKASAGYVNRLFVSNRNAALRYFQIHAKATAPTGGDVPLESYEIPINSVLPLDTTHFSTSGMAVATGVSWAISTTNATFTDAATASEHNVYLGWN